MGMASSAVSRVAPAGRERQRSRPQTFQDDFHNRKPGVGIFAARDHQRRAIECGRQKNEPFGQRHFITRDLNGVLIDVITPIPPTDEFVAQFAPGNAN